MMEFTGKKIIVTGATRSMGQDMALRFAEQGADVVISYRSDPAGAEETLRLIKAMGRNAWAIQSDFSEMCNVASFAEAAIAQLGHIDILINNAGINARETFLDLQPEKMQSLLQVNTAAPLYLLQLCAKNMIQEKIKGCVINISSIAASATFPRGIGYAMSKAAMNKWTQNAALDLAGYGIRVNAIAPGVIKAGMNEDTEATDPVLWKARIDGIPLKRAGSVDDITQMALYLASEKAAWITGKIFEVDGGHVL